MALVTRLGSRRSILSQAPIRQLSTNRTQGITGRGQKAAYAVLGLAGAGAAGVLIALESSPLHAVDLIVHPSKYDWPHSKTIASLDHASIRRGYEVR